MINGVCVNVRAVKTDREHQSKEGETNTTGVLKKNLNPLLFQWTETFNLLSRLSL